MVEMEVDMVVRAPESMEDKVETMEEEEEREEEGVEREEFTEDGTMEDMAETPANMEILVILQPAGRILIVLISASFNM